MLRPLLALAMLAAFATVAPADVASERAALAKARTKWAKQHLRDYRFRLELQCFCPQTYRGPHTVVVRRGRATKAQTTYKRYDTIPKMFNVIEAKLDGGADETTVRYDSRRGFPRSTAIDQIKNAIDDEIVIKIDRFKVLR